MENKITNKEENQNIIPPNVEITEESKLSIFLQQFFMHLGIALLISVVCALLSPRKMPGASDFILNLLKACDGLTIGGALVCCWAAWGLAYNLGSLAIASYSIKKTWQVVTNKGRAELGEKKLGTYDEYLASRRKKRNLLPQFLGGLVPVIASLIISIIWF